MATERKGWFAEWGWSAPQIVVQVHLFSWCIGYSYDSRNLALGLGPIQINVCVTGEFRKSAAKINSWYYDDY